MNRKQKKGKPKNKLKEIQSVWKSEKITLIDANMFQGIEQKDDSFNHDSSRENDDSDIEPGEWNYEILSFSKLLIRNFFSGTSINNNSLIHLSA